MIRKTYPIYFLFFISFIGSAQFGTIGYDFKDPYIKFKGLKFAVRLSTENNIYCPNPENISINKVSENEIILTSKSLSAAGGQLITDGMIELRISGLENERISITAKASHVSELNKSILILIKGIRRINRYFIVYGYSNLLIVLKLKVFIELLIIKWEKKYT